MCKNLIAPQGHLLFKEVVVVEEEDVEEEIVERPKMPQDYEVRSYSDSAGSLEYGGGSPRNEKTSNENKVMVQYM